MGWGSRPALLLIDVCKAYWAPGSPLDLSSFSPARKCPAVIQRLLDAARANGIPVIWTAVEYHPGLDMADAGLFWKKSKSLRVFNRGMDDQGLGGWLEGLEPLTSNGGGAGELVVKKKYASAFFGTVLASDLQNGFRPMVVGTACGDRSEEIQNANLFDLNAKYADVVSEEEAIEHLQAGWPKAAE
ncbi:hypothetical protein PG997_007074 [Apiospora hydei]|uniref:Isochorismatase-like domain-containing protein n=1 Tax=Apiospora hydei TaxID=1337664 RepID=A0ABR1WSB2_9PEZI